MPPLASVPNVLRCDFKYTLGEDTDVLNTIHFHFTGVNSQADNDTFAERMEDLWATNVMPELSSFVTLQQLTVTDLTTPSAPLSIETSGVVGGQAGAQTLAGTAIVVKEPIARRYRGGHPRIYVPGLPAGDVVDPQTLTNAYFANLTAAFHTCFTSAQAGWPAALVTVQSCSVSYFQGFHDVVEPSGRHRTVPNPRGGGPLVDRVLDFIPSQGIGSQRRRNLSKA